MAMLIYSQTPKGASQIFADSKHRCGLYLAFALRNQLSIVGKTGGILPFSSEDSFLKDVHISGSQASYETNVLFDKLIQMAALAEQELIETIVQANKYLSNEKKIVFAYPFNGQDIAQIIKPQPEKKKSTNHQNQIEQANPLDRIAYKLSMLHKKISMLHTIIYDIKDLSLNYTFISWILVKLINCFIPGKKGIPLTRAEIKKPQSYLSENEYRAYFEEYKDQVEAKSGEVDWSKVQGITPADETASYDLISPFSYAIFKNNVQICLREKNKRASTRSIFDLLSLKEEMTDWQVKKYKMMVLMALHPDKNGGAQEATALFTLAQQGFEQWSNRL
ncbi:MAG: J domain-containing protein [Chlamydiia bacterium]|nr:J domain-containing protein [Chlamydiia bacterium]